MPTKIDSTVQYDDLQTQGNIGAVATGVSTPQPKELLFTRDTIESLKPINISDLETDPKGFFAQLFARVKIYYNRYIQATPPTPVKAPSMTKAWLEEEIAKLRAQIESEEIQLDTFINKLSLLTGLSFFHNSQTETEAEKSLREALKKMLQDQRAYYDDNKVYAMDLFNGAFSIVGAVVGIKYDANVAVQTLSGAGQSASKIFGNGVERDKVQIQHLIEQIKQMIEQSRNNRSMSEQQTTKMEDQKAQANQARQQIVSELTR